MSDPVKLLVPADGPYEALGAALARKYVEIAGGTARDAAALADALSAAAARTTKDAGRDAQLALTFELEAGSVVVQVRCGGESVTVTQPIPVSKSS